MVMDGEGGIWSSEIPGTLNAYIGVLFILMPLIAPHMKATVSNESQGWDGNDIIALVGQYVGI